MEYNYIGYIAEDNSFAALWNPILYNMKTSDCNFLIPTWEAFERASK